MDPYLSDPFRGTVERRVLLPGETALSMEIRAALAALSAASMRPRDIDLAIVGSFLPDQIGVGNSAFLARELGLRCAAWNVESACSSALVALQTACALIATGQHENALVVISCSYSRFVDGHDTLGWFLGDAAAAFIVGATPPGVGLLGAEVVHTAATCGSFYYDLFDDPAGGPRVRIQASRETGQLIRDSAEGFVRQCCEGAARAAGTTISEVDFFVFNTPVPWFAAFAARVLGVDPARTLTTYPRYANIGPALLPVNLHEAAATGRIRPGDCVLLFTIGSVSSAASVVLRWGEIALSPLPP
jgi:3-oxoacyl-[acyl-carrier-protein] synthase-3